MMIAERKREFGVLVAIGMQKRKLKRIVTIEMILLGALGLITGLLASVPLILYFYYFPIVLKGDLAKMMEDYNVSLHIATNEQTKKYLSDKLTCTWLTNLNELV